MGQICTCDGGDAEEADSGRVAGGGEDEILFFCDSFASGYFFILKGVDHLNDRADQGSARIHLLVARHCLKKVFIRHTYSSSVVILSMITLFIDYWPIKFLSLKHCSRLI